MLCHRDLEVVSRPGTIIKKSVDRAINEDEVDHFVGLDQFPGACVVSFSFFSRLSPRNNLSDKWVRSVPWSRDQGEKKRHNGSYVACTVFNKVHTNRTA